MTKTEALMEIIQLSEKNEVFSIRNPIFLRFQKSCHFSRVLRITNIQTLNPKLSSSRKNSIREKEVHFERFQTIISFLN